MTPYYIGIDIGTTSTKAVAFAVGGQALAQHTVGYAMQHPQPDWSEQSPAEILDAVVSCLRSVRQQMAVEPAALSFSAAMHSLVPLDTEGQPLSNCIIWADNRSVAYAEALRASPLGWQIYERTGTPVHAMSPLCKLMWLRDHTPALFEQAHKFVGIKEYILAQFFGEYVTDYSLASATGLFDLHTLQWNAQALHTAGITAERLSQPVPPTHSLRGLRAAFVAQTGLAPTTPFFVGGSDGCLANLGTGATAAGTMAVTVGTSGAVRVCVPKPYADATMRTFCYLLTEGRYVIGGGTNSGAVMLQWLRDSVLHRSDAHEQLFAEAAQVEVSAKNPIFLPYLLGERAPLWNAHARGVFFGLDITHGQAHLIRAVMEGVAMSLFSVGSILLAQQPVHTIYASGGFARSPLWLQIVADVFGTQVVVAESVESSALGAVMLAWQAQYPTHTLEASQWVRTSSVYQPQASHHAVYQEVFKKFQRLYGAVEGLF